MIPNVFAKFGKGFITGAIGVSILGTAVNSVLMINGVGWLERMLGSPPDWVWPLTGGLLGGCVQIYRHRSRLKRSVRLDRWAESNGYSFQETVDVDEFSQYPDLFIFRRRKRANNHLQKTINGVDVEMVDLLTWRTSKQNKRAEESTLILLRRSGDAIPEFKLRPTRSLIRTRDCSHFLYFRLAQMDNIARRTLKRFHHIYALIPEARDRSEDSDRLLHGSEDRVDIPPVSPRAVASIFSIPVMQRLVVHSKWYIDSKDGYLAYWKPNVVIPSDQRESNVTTALGLYQSIGNSEDQEQNDIIDLQVLPKGMHEAIASVVGAMTGAIVGLFVGGAGSMILIMLSETPLSPLRFLGPWPLGSVIGAAIGYAAGKWYAITRLAKTKSRPLK